MGFHITQPGSSVATSLIDGEAKPKHVLLLEIKVFFFQTPLCILNVYAVFSQSVMSHEQGNQYRPTKIPLRSVRTFEYAEVWHLIPRFCF
jgi:double-strand break repair protein MRE11